MAKKTSGQRKPKTKPNAPGSVPGHNSDGADETKKLSPDEERQLFLHHRTAWNHWLAKRAVVEQIEKDTKAALKADGFTVKQMQIADDLLTVKGEKKVTGEVADRLKVALWTGHPMGAQLDMFEQPDRTPLVDRAYDVGKQMSMENKPLKPPYDPDTEAYRVCAAGYHDHQRQLAGGLAAPADANQSTMARN